MRLDPKEFKRFKELSKKKDLTDAEREELKALTLKKSDNVGNDVAWHSKYPALFKDATNIAQAYFLGKNYPNALMYDNGIKTPCTLNQGILLNIDTQITPGILSGDNTGLALQARSLWIAERNTFRGLGSYQYTDLAIVLFALLDMFVSIAEAERIYGTYHYYSIRNRTVPASIKQALRVADMAGDLAEFRYRLNVLITHANTLCIPKGISAFADAITLFSNIFLDRPSANAQMFMYTRKCHWDLDETLSTGTNCVLAQSGTSSRSFAEIITGLETQLSLLINSDVVTVICSDLVSCFKENGLMFIEPLPEDYVVIPSYSEERNLQLHNLTTIDTNGSLDYELYYNTRQIAPTPIFNELYTGGKLRFYQYNNGLYFMPAWGEDGVGVVSGSSFTQPYFNDNDLPSSCFQDGILDFWKDEATPDDFMIASRMKSEMYVQSWPLSGVTKHTVRLQTCGLYAINIITVHYFDGAGAMANSDVSMYSTTNGNLSIPTVSLLQWDNAPMIRIYDNGNQEITLFGSIDHIVFVSEENLIALHDTSLLSEWKIDTPFFNTVNR